MEQSLIIKIGARNTNNELFYAKKVSELLFDIAIENEIVTIESDLDNFETVSSDLLSVGYVDLVVKKLVDQKFELINGVCNAALLDRFQQNYCFYTKRKDISFQGIFEQDSNHSILVDCDVLKESLLALNRHLNITVSTINSSNFEQIFKQTDWDAIIFLNELINGISAELIENELISLSPKEFPPAPATGIIVLQTLENNLFLRKKLVEIHQNKIGRISNVERKTQQLLSLENRNQFSIHGETDAADNFHVWANLLDNGDIKKCRISSSTTFKLAESIVNQLTK